MSTEAKRVPIWLDCDPGHDDAFAILLCAHHPSIAFLGISTVHGNASLSQTTSNASSLLVAFSRTDVPIHPGASKPFSRRAVHAADIHGASGLDGTDLLPPPQHTPTPSPIPAVTAMYHALKSQPAGTAWLVATGTLTNVALLLAVYPDIAEHLAGVSIMGGAFEDTLSQASLGRLADGSERPKRIGNTTAFAEFNIYCDPESAQAVLNHPGLSGRVIVIPLDITHTVLATRGVRERMLGGMEGGKGRDSGLRRMMHDLLVFFAGTYEVVFGLTEGPPLHDPVAVAAVLHREGVETRLGFTPAQYQECLTEVGVVTSGHHGDGDKSELGRTVRNDFSKMKNVYVPDGLDVTAFWQCLNECLDRADEKSEI